MAAQKEKEPVSPDVLMDIGLCKPLLMKSKKEPVFCAIGITEDKQGVLLVAKKGSPKALAARMKKEAPPLGLKVEIALIRCGTAVIDPDVDSTLVRMTLSKSPPGAVEKAARARLKLVGLKLEILPPNPALENVPEVDEFGVPIAPGPAGVAAGSPGPAAPGPAAPGPAAPGPAPPGPGGAPGAPADGAAQKAREDARVRLTTALGELMKQLPAIIAVLPARKDDLVGLAGRATIALKPAAFQLPDGEAAATSLVDALRAAVAAAASEGNVAAARAAAAVKTVAATASTSRLAWLAARKKVESEITKLHDKMASAYQDHGFGADLDKIFHSQVEPVLGTLDEALAHKLDECAKATDAVTHGKIVQEAREIIGRYEGYLASEQLIAKLDANPFEPLAIQKTLTATLETLSKSLSTMNTIAARVAGAPR